MKKIMTRLLSLVLLGAFIPGFVLADSWYLEDGDITVNATETSQIVSQGGTSKPDSNPIISTRAPGSSETGATNNTVTITAEKNATANVTLENVNIDTGATGGAAITTSGEGNVNIELDGTNTVQSGNTHAGVEKKDNGTLTITDEDKDGSLTATGGDGGAGIGGGASYNGSNIEISSGEVTAIGGNFGAGIGGGQAGSGSNITISDGKVTATGGGAGAGIGGGYVGSGKGITIEGGEVTAQGDTGGAGIGGGANGTGSDVTISGDAQVKVQGGRANENWHKGAAIGNGGTSTTDGNEVSPNTSDLTVEGFIQIYEPGKNINTDTPYKTIEGQKGDYSWNAGVETAETVPESKAAAYWVCDPEGQSIPYQAQQKDSVLTVTVQADTASLRGTTGSLRQLEAQGITEIRFVTNGAQSAFTLSDLLTSGTGSFTLTHAGDQVTCTLGDTDISGILK
ncbi:hypothetical protein KQI10_09240 [Pseudoflavonifractor sp. MSJ-30]|uniref:hypothetical protein n=1 Tax=Pseudoflavonifractor sp. MSJ-30 TaxID=2841525 RepID=UPI001C0FA071|nr:hypothetical protein [Pseudoflavonifractor sp. MSJ-30]MBU5453356.1 hypothetical protein [Pseudoflavonifractor sp. MSJ-30]